ncbi:ABC transporter permease [Vogesella sp. LIG4]|uniref:ABC transporter permease n=1 Tax=Vogesella sp. LIG4 TaxID=1192162 RepID=UPI0008201805|nr:ABC transporter permease [Vogesella sp. LIG4]SCK27188.1 simple sugar transport system permease protein [Vogesella sp. LIG4]
MSQPANLPRWAALWLMPVLNLVAALFVSGLVIALIGEDPIECLKLLINGAFGYPEGIGYTLFYTTSFIFTGLAVAAAFHAGLFNIGGEGQMYLSGLGVTLVCLQFGGLPGWLLIPLALLGAILFGAAWAFVPAWLQAKRGSHIVVTTIMFNFIASSLMNWLLVDKLRMPGSQVPATVTFAQTAWVPLLKDVFAPLGFVLPNTPLNASFFLAILALVLFYVVVWHSPQGFVTRTVGLNEKAARYAGMPVDKIIILVMCVSGALAGMASINELLGSTHRMNLGFTNGIGFVGIAVALMGRNHPVGILLSALLFGALTQGGLDLSFEKPAITREMIIFTQGLIILFCGALENLFQTPLSLAFKRMLKKEG